MKVFKFGGASVKNAPAVQNTASILQRYEQDNLWVVVSAMGKTTNALEKVVIDIEKQKDYAVTTREIFDYHHEIISSLFTKNTEAITQAVKDEINQIDWLAKGKLRGDALYDQVVSIGEVMSTRIIAAYLQTLNLPVQWVDARELIITDDNFREGRVNVASTKLHLQEVAKEKNKIYLTQGFIGRAGNGLTTTLGREGSDYTAAIIASCLQAESVTIWKDVPGVMNADPKRMPAAVVFEELPFKEASEMTYYGASVIHPKTIKPLANAGIPLYVKNFDNPDLPGTKIHECKLEDIPPLIVVKDNQCLVSCKVTDYSFINEAQLSIIFKALAETGLKINLMQNSAISFTFCVDYRESKLNAIIDLLRNHFEVYYNTNLQLITVKNYDQKIVAQYRNMKGVIVEQSSRSTFQVLIKPELAS